MRDWDICIQVLNLVTSFRDLKKMKAQTLIEEETIQLNPGGMVTTDDRDMRRLAVLKSVFQPFALIANALNFLLDSSGKPLARSESNRNLPVKIVISKQLYPILRFRRGNVGFNEL